MKKKHTKHLVWFGVLCALLAAVSSWYTIRFNNARFIVPMELSDYVFRVQDLPMILSGALLLLYVLYLFVLLAKAAAAGRRKGAAAQSTRAIDPKLGWAGFLGFAGFVGFWTYSVDKTTFPFLFFLFFGFFGFFYEGKMARTLMDERYKENRLKAHTAANKTALTIIFLAVLLLGQGKLMGNPEYTLIALIIVISLALALDLFLCEYLLFRYDHDEPLEESEE